MSIDEAVTDAEIVRDATTEIWQKDVTEREVGRSVQRAVTRARVDERRKLHQAMHAEEGKPAATEDLGIILRGLDSGIFDRRRRREP